MTINWWTLGIQSVNVVILVWLLQHFFWRPIAAMVEQRRAAAAKAVADGEASRTQAAAGLADIAKTRSGFENERKAILEGAHKVAETAAAAVQADASKQAAALIAAAKAEIATDWTDAEAAWAGRSSEVAVAIAGRLAARLEGPQVQTAFLNWLVTAIEAMPTGERQAVTADGAALEAFSATALDPAQQERTGALIGKAFGAQPHITFTVDPALIAGLELRGEHFTVANSWRADLGTILGELTHETRH